MSGEATATAAGRRDGFQSLSIENRDDENNDDMDMDMDMADEHIFGKLKKQRRNRLVRLSILITMALVAGVYLVTHEMTKDEWSSVFRFHGNESGDGDGSSSASSSSHDEEDTENNNDNENGNNNYNYKSKSGNNNNNDKNNNNNNNNNNKNSKFGDMSSEEKKEQMGRYKEIKKNLNSHLSKEEQKDLWMELHDEFPGITRHDPRSPFNRHKVHDKKQRVKDKIRNKNQNKMNSTTTSNPRFTVLAELDHDATSFTQGLSYNNGILYESNGIYGKSSIRRLNATTGELLQSTPMDKTYFGEGMTIYGDNELIQITWKKKMGFIYNATDLTKTQEFHFDTKMGQGWGITYNNNTDEFIVSDGSDMLHFWDRKTLKEKRRIKVTVSNDNHKGVYDKPIRNLNELEFWNNTILSNIWYSDVVLQIDPETCQVKNVFDFAPLWPRSTRTRGTDVFNGISVSDKPDEIFVTGKLWPKIYRVKLEV